MNTSTTPTTPKTPPAPAPKAKATKAKKPKKMTEDARAALSILAARVTAEVKGNIPAMIEDLEEHHGLKIKTDKKKAFQSLTMGGITVERPGNIRLALENWANAARRQVLKEG